MGKSLAEKLHNGELYPSEKIEPKDAYYKERLQKCKDIETIIENKIPQELLEDFKSYKRLMLDCNSRELDATFAAGFNIAIKFILEAIGG